MKFNQRGAGRWPARLVFPALFAVAAIVVAQDTKVILPPIEGSSRPVIAIPDLRGSGEAQALMPAFNQTLWGDISGSAFFKMAPKTMYPTTIPQHPTAFSVPTSPPPAPRGRAPQPAAAPSGGGRWLTDWSGPPVSANYLAFGYSAVQNGVLVFRGWLYDLRNTASPQVIGKNYLATVDEAGARKVAHEFAADILALFGGQSLAGTHIYFVSDRTGNKEIWAMDFDGKNQRQITRFNSTSIEPSIAPDGSKVAFTSWLRGNAGIFVYSVDPIRD